jgi:hypothetical protein
VVGEVSPQSLISLMVHGQRGEAPPTSLLSNIARDMGETVGDAIDKVNAVNEGVQRQFKNLATAMGLNPDKAADWLRDHRKDTSMAALQAHCPPLQEGLQTPIYRERKPLIFQRVGCSFGEPRRPHQPAR